MKFPNSNIASPSLKSRLASPNPTSRIRVERSKGDLALRLIINPLLLSPWNPRSRANLFRPHWAIEENRSQCVSCVFLGPGSCILHPASPSPMAPQHPHQLIPNPFGCDGLEAGGGDLGRPRVVAAQSKAWGAGKIGFHIMLGRAIAAGQSG